MSQVADDVLQLREGVDGVDGYLASRSIAVVKANVKSGLLANLPLLNTKNAIERYSVTLTCA